MARRVAAWLGMGLLVSLSARAEEPDRYARPRAAMVKGLRSLGYGDERVLAAMGEVPRHLFVPEEHRKDAYDDRPLPIGEGQTISAPHMVARMTELLQLRASDRVLEIGTGRGYAAAVAGRLAKEVHTIEIMEPLCEAAKETLPRAGAQNVFVYCGDGYKGIPEKAPFDKISVTAAPDHIPPALVEQLARRGRMVIPVGPEGRDQKLQLVLKDEKGGVRVESLDDVRFVPFLRK
jgi:protein-L-isoaspartate(D-aspartate) O-methyltransferase